MDWNIILNTVIGTIAGSIIAGLVGIYVYEGEIEFNKKESLKNEARERMNECRLSLMEVYKNINTYQKTLEIVTRIIRGESHGLNKTNDDIIEAYNNLEISIVSNAMVLNHTYRILKLDYENKDIFLEELALYFTQEGSMEELGIVGMGFDIEKLQLATEKVKTHIVDFLEAITQIEEKYR